MIKRFLSITNDGTFADTDDDMIEEMNAIAKKHSVEFMQEIKDVPHLQSCHIRPVKSAYEDGFRCGIQWVMENPYKFIALFLKSLIRRIRGRCKPNSCL